MTTSFGGGETTTAAKDRAFSLGLNGIDRLAEGAVESSCQVLLRGGSY